MKGALYNLVVILLVMSGCSSTHDTPLYDIKLTQTSIGPIKQNTDFSLTALHALLPGFDIKPFTSMNNPKDIVYRIFYHDKEWMQVIPTKDKKKISEIYIVSPDVKHKFKIGETLDDDHWEKASCKMKHHKVECCDKNIKYFYHDDILKSMVLTF